MPSSKACTFVAGLLTSHFVKRTDENHWRSLTVIYASRLVSSHVSLGSVVTIVS